MKIWEFASLLGIDTCLEFSLEALVPEEKIRDLCIENKCGNYGKNYMCPPYVGSIEEVQNKLIGYNRAVLFQYIEYLDVKKDKEGVRQTKIDFHNKILRIEEFLREREKNHVWGMIGGSCELCDFCRAKISEPCPYPDKAKTSLEAIAINVMNLLDKFGLDSKFHEDTITWTGCVLFI